jgi:hypothetical protein
MNSDMMTTSFLLPRLDDMVLFKPIATPLDQRDNLREPMYMETSRMANISNELDRYNRWLAFAESSSSERKIRSAAVDLQRIVQDINITISNMMIEVDQKILTLQDQTDAFVEAVQEGQLWRSKGTLLDLSLEELELVLAKHPQRNSETQRKHLCELVRKAAKEEIWGSPTRRQPGRLAAKLLRLVKEVQSCPEGGYEAFHLYAFLIAHVFNQRDFTEPRGTIGLDMDFKSAEILLLRIASESRRAKLDGTKREPMTFFNFALVKRTIWNAMPANCLTLGSRAYPEVSLGPMYPPSSQPCHRPSVLSLIERLQIEAYGEIKSGIMLTLAPKLPKELCVLIFEFAMANEEIDTDPAVFERTEERPEDRDDDRDEDDEDALSTSRPRWTVKSKYQCYHIRMEVYPPGVWN